MHNHFIFFQNQRHSTQADYLSGVELREMLKVPPYGDLVIEGKGETPDRILQDYEVVELGDDPLHVYLRAPTTFGA